jgi:hypothetical protein
MGRDEERGRGRGKDREEKIEERQRKEVLRGREKTKTILQRIMTN